jgi:hypothetical protein
MQGMKRKANTSGLTPLFHLRGIACLSCVTVHCTYPKDEAGNNDLD